MKKLLSKAATALCIAVFSFSAGADDSEQCMLSVDNMRDTYSKSSIEATVILSEQYVTEPFSHVHYYNNGIPYSSWKTLNNEVEGYALRKGKGFDFNQNRGYLGPMVWHQSYIFDRIFSNTTTLNGYECSIVGRTRLAGRRVTVMQLSSLDVPRYNYIVSKDVDTNLPVELAVMSPDKRVITKMTVTALHSASGQTVNFPDEAFDRIDSMLKQSKQSDADNSMTPWSELKIPRYFSLVSSGIEAQEGADLPYQKYTDGLVDFKVYRNLKTSLNIVSVSNGTITVVRKNGRDYELSFDYKGAEYRRLWQ